MATKTARFMNELTSLDELMVMGFVQKEEFEERRKELYRRLGREELAQFVPESMPPTQQQSSVCYCIDILTSSEIGERHKTGNSHCEGSCDCPLVHCFQCDRSVPACAQEDHLSVCLAARHQCPDLQYGCDGYGFSRFDLCQHLTSNCALQSSHPRCCWGTTATDCVEWKCACGFSSRTCAKDDHTYMCPLMTHPCPAHQYGRCTKNELTREEMRVHLMSGECPEPVQETCFFGIDLDDLQDMRRHELLESQSKAWSDSHETNAFKNIRCPLRGLGCTHVSTTEQDSRRHLTNCPVYILACPSCKADVTRADMEYSHSCAPTKHALCYPPT